jgi:hypothetical protein
MGRGFVLAAVLAANAFTALASAAPRSRHASPRSTNASPGLVFGIYPGGPVGTVGPSGRVVPEDPAKGLAALEQLRPPGRPFVIRLYASYTGPSGSSAAEQLGATINGYEAAGFDVELVLTYRPADGGSPQGVSGFAEFVRETVRTLGRSRRFVSLQVANEVNVRVAPNAADGFYAGAEDALIAGVMAASDERSARRLTWLAIGFNWAFSSDPAEGRFWRYLRQRGGRRFVRCVDWVGLDIYPGTWSTPTHAGEVGGAPTGYLAKTTARSIDGALRQLRDHYMPLARLGRRVPLSVTENGYPTGPERTPAMQATALRAAVTAVDSLRAIYNVTAYRWFDLRDADSAGQSFESHYGLLNDDYTPKPAFAAYRRLVAELSGPRR